MNNMNEQHITNNTHRQQFELETDGKRSIVAYQKVDDETLALTHTEVDPALEGHGVGSRLVEEVLQYAEQNNLKIVPLCPFVDAYLKRHPAWNRVVSTAYNTSDF
ncbi:GNAT family N-acetyltransferase [Spirosoma pulveris]